MEGMPHTEANLASHVAREHAVNSGRLSKVAGGGGLDSAVLEAILSNRTLRSSCASTYRVPGSAKKVKTDGIERYVAQKLKQRGSCHESVLPNYLLTAGDFRQDSRPRMPLFAR